MQYFHKAPVYFYGSIIVVVTLILAFLLVLDKNLGNLRTLILMAIGSLAVRGVVWLKKKFALSADELYARDPRDPVLYLRSFNDDEGFTANSSDGIYFDSKQMFEESLVHALKHLGPVLAIGRPNERLPPLGAARMYVGEDGWQERVGHLIRQSSLVVMVLGKTASLGWEIKTLKALGVWHKTLFVFPPTSEPDLRERWLVFSSHADQMRDKLPASVSPTVVYATGNPDGSITLIENRKVRRKKKTASYRWSSYASSLRPLLQARAKQA